MACPTLLRPKAPLVDQAAVASLRRVRGIRLPQVLDKRHRRGLSRRDAPVSRSSFVFRVDVDVICCEPGLLE
jgi:hypothetical protein